MYFLMMSNEEGLISDTVAQLLIGRSIQKGLFEPVLFERRLEKRNVERRPYG